MLTGPVAEMSFLKASGLPSVAARKPQRRLRRRDRLPLEFPAAKYCTLPMISRQRAAVDVLQQSFNWFR
jgi:hypothetical protein